jgi:hypothetical protein
VLNNPDKALAFKVIFLWTLTRFNAFVLTVLSFKHTHTHTRETEFQKNTILSPTEELLILHRGSQPWLWYMELILSSDHSGALRDYLLPGEFW